jgi:hypothetical protein
MKLKITEHSSSFWLNFEAETVEEASMLVRMGINAIASSACVHAYAAEKGGVSGSISFRKAKSDTGYIRRRRG